MWTSEKIHNELRQIAKTLNDFSLIEIVVVIIFTLEALNLLVWYKSMMTPENFNSTAFWGAVVGISGLIFGALKHMNDTFNKKDK